MADVSGHIDLSQKGRDWMLEKARKFMGADDKSPQAAKIAALVEELDDFSTINSGVTATTKGGVEVDISIKIAPNG